MSKKPKPTRLIRTSGKVEKFQGGEAKIEMDCYCPELRQDERNLVLQLAHKKLDDSRVYRLHFLAEFEREELISMPKYFALCGTQYYL